MLSVIEFRPPPLHQRAFLGKSATSTEKEVKTKAKMGMLIVHGPGQEMMDLLVAANMVAFLRRWESWEKERRAMGG